MSTTSKQGSIPTVQEQSIVVVSYRSRYLTCLLLLFFEKGALFVACLMISLCV